MFLPSVLFYLFIVSKNYNKYKVHKTRIPAISYPFQQSVWTTDPALTLSLTSLVNVFSFLSGTDTAIVFRCLVRLSPPPKHFIEK